MMHGAYNVKKRPTEIIDIKMCETKRHGKHHLDLSTLRKVYHLTVHSTRKKIQFEH